MLTVKKPKYDLKIFEDHINIESKANWVRGTFKMDSVAKWR